MITWIKKFLKKETLPKESIQFPTLPESDIREVREFALNEWKLGTIHGLSHW